MKARFSLVNFARPSRSDSSGTSRSAASVQSQVRTIEVDGQEDIWSIALLANHIVTGGKEGKIRWWRLEDCKEETPSVDARSPIYSIAVSRDGRRIVSGTFNGLVTVWNAISRTKSSEFPAHKECVRAMDISPDGTKIATGSYGLIACVWSLSAGHRLLFRPLHHDDGVVAVKFSESDGAFIATATREHSVHVYDSQNGQRLFEFPIKVQSTLNQSLAWSTNSNELFVLSHDGNIHSIDASTRKTLSRWRIHSSKSPNCIALASNGTRIAASAYSSISFWDITTTHNRIEPTIQDSRFVQCMAISPRYGLVTGGGRTVNVYPFCEDPPSPWCDDPHHQQESQATISENNDGEQNGGYHVLSDIISIQKTMEPVQMITDPQLGGLERRIRGSTHPIPDESRDEIVEDLQKKIQELGDQLAASRLEGNALNETIDSLKANYRAQEENSNNKIAKLNAKLADSSRIADNLNQIISAHEQRHQCEALFVKGHTTDAAASLLRLTSTVSEEARANESIKDWLLDFTDRCVTKLETLGDEARNSGNHEQAITVYSTALSLGHSTQTTLLLKWAGTMLIGRTASEALNASSKFKLAKLIVHQAICDVLEKTDRIDEAISCFGQMGDESPPDTSANDQRTQWELDFRGRCAKKLVNLGDSFMESQDHDAAIQQYSDALTLEPADQSDIFLKRSQVRVAMGSWEDALIDADEVIKLDRSSYKGYERKHAALQGMGRHKEAFMAFKVMLSKLKQSPDPRIQGLHSQYVDATTEIRAVIDRTIRHMPRVLIDTATGHLHDKMQQAEAFEKLPVYDEMRSLMTTRLDHARISKEVKKYYKYVMFSHRWENGEPLFQDVEKMSIFNLGPSSPNIKLRTLCELALSFGFEWVWSDTCCIDRKNTVVLQESLVAMFTWYRGSSLTIIYLRDVRSQSQRPGDLKRSIWNTRAWTYQEYVAAEVVQFYTKDWKLYLGVNLLNHKESPEIISEMQQAVGGLTQELEVLRPGLERVREKLCLASARETTLPEDIAYSLLGIFNVAIPVIYGEGDRAVGRLLEHILSGSGDVTILAWTGRSGSYNSCLPVDLMVYSQLMPPHIPSPIESADMDQIVAELRSSLPDLSLAVTIYNRLNDLPSPTLTASRLRLPAFVFPLSELVDTPEPDPVTNLRVYHATTPTFGDIEIKTTDNLTGMTDLCLIHPWIRPLLKQMHSNSGPNTLDRTTQALRLIVRFKQPFGALLFGSRSAMDYRRVAADNLIMVQVREEVSLNYFMDNIRTIEVQ